jgi:soluble lytic murein transglycosylase-like protein
VSAAVTAVQQQIIAAANSAGVDPAIALAVANQESGFNQGAIGSSGEVGIFQLMPSTAAQLNVNPYDTTQNIQGGISYLASLYSQFGDWGDALAAYNWGPGNVLSSGGVYPSSVAGYVNSVLSQASSYSASLGTATAAAGSSLLTPALSVAPILDSVGLSSLTPYLPTTPLGMAAAAAGIFVLAWLLD